MATEPAMESTLMDKLERIGEFLAALSERVVKLLMRLFGSSNERYIRKLGYLRARSAEQPPQVVPGSLLAQVNDLEEHMRSLSEDQLKALTPVFKERLAQPATLQHVMPAPFAPCRHA